MKLNLDFEKIPFSYTAPVVAGTKLLTDNTLLRVSHAGRILVDLSVLPGFHHYSLDEWKYFLEQFFAGHDLDRENVQLDKLFFNMTSDQIHSSELAYAVEAVLFAWLKNFAPEKVPSYDKNSQRVHGLYSATVPFDNVPDCVKIKIRPHKEKEAAHAIRQCLAKNGNVHFRFDGNRTFELDDLLSFLQFLSETCPPFAVDFIEEPFVNAADFLPFQLRSSIPLALDESLPFLLDQLGSSSSEYLILKPSVLGLSKCFELTRKFAPRTIISSTYETSTAMEALYALASLNPGQSHGLDTLKFLPKPFGI